MEAEISSIVEFILALAERNLMKAEKAQSFVEKVIRLGQQSGELSEEQVADLTSRQQTVFTSLEDEDYEGNDKGADGDDDEEDEEVNDDEDDDEERETGGGG